MSKAVRLKSPDGTVAYIAQDADGTWLWDVSWPGRPDAWDGPAIVPGVPTRRRGGKAPTEDGARSAVRDALNDGRPK